MACLSCGSEEQRDFTAEMNLHFAQGTDLVKPSVFIFPRVIICVNCGLGTFRVPESESKVLGIQSHTPVTETPIKVRRNSAL